jgi:hypothetical protein
MEMTLTTNDRLLPSGIQNLLNPAYFHIKSGFTQTTLAAKRTLTIENTNYSWMSRREYQSGDIVR